MNRKSITIVGVSMVTVALAAMPSLALATTAQAPAGTTLAAGVPVKAQSTNFVINDTVGNVSCNHVELTGEVTTNGGSHFTSSISNAAFTDCADEKFRIDNSTNVSGVNPWRMQVQQPDAGGNIIAHLLPASGSTLQFTAQFQAFGISVGTCSYKKSTLQFEGTEASDVLSVAAGEALELEAGKPELCGEVFEVAGAFQTTSQGNKLTVDMS